MDLNSTNFSHLRTIFLPKKLKGIGHRKQKAKVELLRHFYFYFYVINFFWVCNVCCVHPPWCPLTLPMLVMSQGQQPRLPPNCCWSYHLHSINYHPMQQLCKKNLPESVMMTILLRDMKVLSPSSLNEDIVYDEQVSRKKKALNKKVVPSLHGLEESHYRFHLAWM